jgi:hypothetical protein
MGHHRPESRGGFRTNPGLEILTQHGKGFYELVDLFGGHAKLTSLEGLLNSYGT